jgi:hypothetical protein
MILALATALVVAIHVAGVYLGLRGSPIPRRVGVPISLFEAAAYPYAPLLAAVFAPMHVAGAAASWAGLQRRGGSGRTASTRPSWRRFCTCRILL